MVWLSTLYNQVPQEMFVLAWNLALKAPVDRRCQSNPIHHVRPFIISPVRRRAHVVCLAEKFLEALRMKRGKNNPLLHL